MANYVAKARSNYFRVRDRSEFEKWAEELHNIEVVGDSEGRVALLETDGEGLSFIGAEDGEEHDIFSEVSSHLAEGSIAIFYEVGAVKLAALNGSAVAVHPSGETLEVNLDDIHRRITERRWSGEATTAEN